MSPDASWPNLPGYTEFSAEDHAAHTTPRGVAYPETLMSTDGVKAGKDLMKAVKKPHIKLTNTRRSRAGKRKKRR